MAAELKNYDPKNIVIVFGAIVITAGLAEDTFVSAERDEEMFTKKAGADGEVTRTRNRNKMGRVTLTLQQTAEANQLLSAQAAVDELTGNGVAPLLIKDLGGTSLAAAANAWIAKRPAMAYGKDSGNREWVLDCAELILNEGGN